MKITTGIFLFLLGLATGILTLQTCNKSKEEQTGATATKQTVEINEFRGKTDQSKTKDSLIYQPYPVYVPVTDSFLQLVDTAAILRDYYQVYVYTNAYIDSTLSELIVDTVTQNRIQGRHREFTVICRDTIIEKTTIKSPNGWYLGVQTDLKTLAPGILYLRNKSAFGVNYNLKDKEFLIQYNYKLF